MSIVPPSATIVSLRPSGPNRLPAGTRLNGIFEIESFLAAGGMAEVYRARTVETGDAIAIKVIKPEIVRDHTLMGLLRKEAATLSRISHDAVVRYFLFSVDRELECPYLAMELVEGPSLAELLAQGALSFDSVRVLQERIGSGLDVVHRLGITHRDISPDNIILPRSDPGKAKLIDFGIARSAFGEGTIIAERFAGKLNFASPEHVGLHGGVVTPKSDIYSFGLTLAAALLGSPIDMGGTQLNMVRRRQSVPDLSQIDLRIRGSIAAMLQPDPKDRPATIGPAETPTPTPALAPAQAAARPDVPQSRRRLYGVAGAVATLLCVVGGIAAWRLTAGYDAKGPEPAAPLSERAAPETRDSAPASQPGRAAAEAPRPPADNPDPAAPPGEAGARQPAADPDTRPSKLPPESAAPSRAGGEAASPVADANGGAVRDCAGCPQMVPVPAGSFSMGSAADATEKPVHTVRLKAFLIGQAPVSVGEWRLCAKSGACELNLEGDADQIAGNLSWDDAQQYLRWLSKTANRDYRLPTEAEWEYAARGGTRTRFWWGDRYRSDLAACRVGNAATAGLPPPASAFQSNPFGVVGTTCLVAQWVSDCWHKNFRGAPGDGSAWGVRNCQQRVLRGGSWRSASETVRITSRDSYDPTVRYPTNGFRVARDP